jgi:hypothetical protein
LEGRNTLQPSRSDADGDFSAFAVCSSLPAGRRIAAAVVFGADDGAAEEIRKMAFLTRTDAAASVFLAVGENLAEIAALV